MSSIQVGEALSCNDTPAVTLSDWLSEKAKCWIWNKDMEQRKLNSAAVSNINPNLYPGWTPSRSVTSL